MPAFLAGREQLLSQADVALRNVQQRYPQQSVVYYGLRGVGKTVVLNAIEGTADDLNILYTHIEADETGDFTNKFVVAVRRFAQQMSGMQEAARAFVQKCLQMV